MDSHFIALVIDPFHGGVANPAGDYERRTLHGYGGWSGRDEICPTFFIFGLTGTAFAFVAVIVVVTLTTFTLRILASYKAFKGKGYRYPFSFRLVPQRLPVGKS